MSIPKTVKDEALKLFLEQGLSIVDIAKQLNQKWPTVASWRKKHGWDALREEVKVQAIVAVTKSSKDHFVKLSEKHLKQYGGLSDGASKAIKAQNGHFFENMTDMDLVRTVDIGIKGQRAIQTGMISLQFAQEIYEVIRKHVTDETIIRAIATDLRRIVAEYET